MARRPTVKSFHQRFRQLTYLGDAATVSGVPGEANVQTALSLGWTMADLYAQGLPGPARPLPAREHLQGVGALSGAQRALLRLDQIDAALSSLSPAIQAHGLPVPGCADLRAVQANAEVDTREREAEIRALHVVLLRRLTAVDYRLGKAYGLGRALADTCRAPHEEAKLARRLGRYRLDNLRGWLNDLASALPAHSARGVLSGLTRWEAWVANLCAMPPAEGAWERAEESVEATLRRQGELWRAVLTGEKDARDMLSVDSYLKGADTAVQRAFALMWRFLKRPALAVPFVLLSAIAAGLLVWGVIGDGAAQLTAGIATAAATLGITWKTVEATAQKLGAALEKPLWGAELDVTVGEALTYLPVVPVREPRADVLLDAPRLLRGIGDSREPQAGGMPAAEQDYLRNWATAAGYIEAGNDDRGAGYERLSHQGRRLAEIPAGERGNVRAALSAGRGIAPPEEQEREDDEREGEGDDD
jgi:hypothetical protein